MVQQVQNASLDLTDRVIIQTQKNAKLKIELPFSGEINEDLLTISHIKRFHERWQADPNFRKLVSVDTSKAIVDYNLKVDPEKIRPLWDTEIAEASDAEISEHTLLKRYLTTYEQIRPQLQLIAGSAREPAFQVWRERHIARTGSQFSKLVQDAIVHAPFTFELTKGCSVGCWFCGVSAPKLGDIFTYNEENAKLWHEVLELMKEILGDAAKTGFCYWATDPLDNPDYEKFCIDFHEILGTFPQTTTSQPMKDPARVRSLLKLSKDRGCPLNRFSILSLKMLNQVHKEFSAEELAFVKLVLLNDESDRIKANAGRARERNQKKASQDDSKLGQGTIACVSGFLFNMVERSVKLISPCNADDRWPKGYMIYDEGTFNDASDLKILLERMITRHMPLTVRPNDLIRFRRDLKYESLPDGFQVSTKLKTFKFQNSPDIKELGEAIHKGNKTAAEIAFLFDIRGISPAYTFENLNLMLKQGILDDEPTPMTN